MKNQIIICSVLFLCATIMACQKAKDNPVVHYLGLFMLGLFGAQLVLILFGLL